MIRIPNNKLLILPVAALGFIGCGDGVTPPTAELAIMPEEVDDGWSVGDMSELGMNAGIIKDMFNAIKRGDFKGIDGVVIAKSGYLVFEAYFNGYKRDKRHDTRSATKSFTSALIGIAIDQQHIAAVTDSVYSHLQTYAPFDNWSSQKEQITVEHLLTMTPGWDCDDWRGNSQGNERNMYEESNWVRFILDLPMINTPGTTFGYCTGGVVVLGELLKSATDLSADEFAERHLFRRLGITNYNWEYTPADQVDTGGHIWMTPRDMAKIGQLFLQGGTWQDAQIISSSWVDQSTAFHVMAGSDEFGYLWWRDSFSANARDFGVYSASGNGGQFVFVVPSEQMVAVFTGSNYNSSLGDQPYTILEQHILKAIN